MTIEGTADELLRALVEEKVGEVLDRRGLRAVAVRVGFTDQNGPKGGEGKHCAVTVEVPRHTPLHVGATAASERGAFEVVLDTLERQAVRERERLRATRRRPKKYFVAKRLLSPETTLPAPPSVPEAPPRRKQRG